MKRSLLTPRRAMTVLAVLLLVSSLLPVRAAQSVTAGPRALFAMTVEPVAGLLYRLSMRVRGEAGPRVADEVESLPRQVLEADYERALQIISALTQVNQDLRQQIAQFGQIQQHRGEDGMRGISLISARVTSSRGDRQTPMVTIDLGSRRGAEQGLAVAAGSSLVGRIEQVGPLTADVKLITTANTDVQVRIRPPVASDDPRDYPARLRVQADGRTFSVDQVGLREPVRPGDLAHLADPRWPEEAQGFIVGQVVDVSEDPNNPYQFKRVIVQPIPPMGALSRVTVLVPTE